jgi:hypothetical protein
MTEILRHFRLSVSLTKNKLAHLPHVEDCKGNLFCYQTFPLFAFKPQGRISKQPNCKPFGTRYPLSYPSTFPLSYHPITVKVY